MPLALTFALYAAIAARYDVESSGPTYADRELLAALEKVSAKPSPRRS